MKKKLVFVIFMFNVVCGFSQTKDTLTHDSCLIFANAISSQSAGEQVFCMCEIVKFHIEIYDSRGKLIYKSDSIDGTYPTTKPGYARSNYSAYLNWNYFRLDDGIYNYVVIYSVKVNGREEERALKGSINYVR